MQLSDLLTLSIPVLGSQAHTITPGFLDVCWECKIKSVLLLLWEALPHLSYSPELAFSFLSLAFIM